jgi:anti-sigma-K factor RskA
VNIKEYISSGVVESYVLGLLSAQERFEFEQYCEAYPELRAAREAFELAIEKQAMKDAVAPPAGSREKIWSAIQQTTKTSKIISMEPTTTRRSSGFSWLAAASIILFLVAGYFAYTFYNQNKELKKSNQEITAKLNNVDSLLNERKALEAENVTVVNMVAMKPNAPSANIYWDTASASVYMLVKNMPKLASDKQYQLWSLIDSNGLKPTSLGLFDGGKEKVIIKMNNAQKADAFAITIEKRGNTEGPDLGQLQNMGKTKLQ